MKQTLYTLAVLLTSTLTAIAQFPFQENFNPPMAWSTTNGAGIQFYGGSEYYATTNVGNTPYPNGSNIAITSPTYNLTTCLSGLTVSFPLSGIIENNWDFLRFQYRVGAGPWITVQSFTGTQNVSLAYASIPNTATQFRFLLQTDGSVNTYGFPFINVYYYDIAYFNINCVSVLPTYLENFEESDGTLVWRFSDPLLIDNYSLQISQDGYTFEDRYTAETYFKSIDGLNYYRVKYTVDYETMYSEIIAVDNRSSKKIIGIYSLDGKEVSIDCNCVKIVRFDDGTTKIIY